MRGAWLAVAASVAAVSAWGQNVAGQTPELPPLQQQLPQPGSPPVQKAPVPPPPLAPVSPDTAEQTDQAPAGPPAAFGRPNLWLPATVARLQALDKVNAKATDLTIDVGKTATFGSLTIAVKACFIRPPDQPADAAAYLDVTDSHSDSLGFQGWMLREEPSVSMMQHPVYDVRVAGCN